MCCGGSLVVWLSQFLSDYLIRFDKDKKFNRNVLEYGLKLLINPLLVVIFSLLISLVFHNFYDTLIALISLTALRYWTSGHHLRSSDACVIFSVAIMVTITQLSYLLIDWITVINFITLILVLTLAPFNTYTKDKTYFKRKGIATTLVILNICFPLSPVISVAYFLQSVDLIKLRRVSTK